MPDGLVTKALAGYYFVLPDDGSETLMCRAKGRFRQDGFDSPLVGDRVSVELGRRDATVTRVHARKNRFIRPAVANIDALVLVSCRPPPGIDTQLIDRMIVTAEAAECEPIICFTKIDLEPPVISDDYRRSGFRVFEVSSKSGVGIPELTAALTEAGVTAFCGNTGAGKTSVLNAMGLSLQTDIVSEKLGRGKHTTRHVELHTLSSGAMIIDTPGFSSFDGINDMIEPEDLALYFRDFAETRDKCRFRDCLHKSEPDCAVREAVRNGNIIQFRYVSYLSLLEKAQSAKKNLYR